MQALKSAVISRDMFKARVDRGVRRLAKATSACCGTRAGFATTSATAISSLHFEHHQCHAASAFFVSGFDQAAIMTWDGTGEDTTTLFSRGDDRNIRTLKRIKLPHSLGQFYSAVTNYLGFDMFEGDEWKVMDSRLRQA